MVLDFSKVGWKLAVKEFSLSLIKTAAAAGVAFAIQRLAEIHLPVDSMDAAAVIAAVGLLRALLTSLGKWLTVTQTSEVVVG